MADKIKFFVTENTVPYNNIAMEEYFLDHVEENEVLLYLWQNRQTVVIGKNQNAYKECRVNEIMADGGYIARRLSGGGAVFHDLGNLNFTFLAREKNYDVAKQLQVIIEACKSLGISAYKSGRNDILVSEKKFSGNAFYSRGDRKYHHGTILIDADMDHLSKYLNVPEDKLKAKGVVSVKNRVCNLNAFNPDITVETMKKALLNAFETAYRKKAEEKVLDTEALNAIEKFREKFASDTWIYGKKVSADYVVEKRFPWGNVEINIGICGNHIGDCEIYSDALDVDFAESLKKSFVSEKFEKENLKDIVRNIEDIGELIKGDLLNLLEEQIL